MLFSNKSYKILIITGSSSAKRSKHTAWMKTEDITKMIEDDTLSIISTVSSDSMVSSISNASSASRRSTRNTPVKDDIIDTIDLTEAEIVIPKLKFTVRGTSPQKQVTVTSSIAGSPQSASLQRAVMNLQQKESAKNKNQTPTKAQDIDDDEIIERVKKCRTDPRRRSIATVEERKPEAKSERKVRRVQSVRLKRIGEEYQSFRNPTPDSEGRKVRSRYSVFSHYIGNRARPFRYFPNLTIEMFGI